MVPARTDLGISTHVLNTSSGLPAVGLHVKCQRMQQNVWIDVHAAVTDDEGRVKAMLQGTAMELGVYRLLFETEAWFARSGTVAFFPCVTIEFKVLDAGRHHHVPLLLSPFGYTTYRGS